MGTWRIPTSTTTTRNISLSSSYVDFQVEYNKTYTLKVTKNNYVYYSTFSLVEPTTSYSELRFCSMILNSNNDTPAYAVVIVGGPNSANAGKIKVSVPSGYSASLIYQVTEESI